jgi:bifunctional DNA-binding transcriptional regulator/antitoxin component of YhaV-PrlF toxin-antitoxin module
MKDSIVGKWGRVTVPKAVCDQLGMQVGDRLRFMPIRKGFRLVAMTGDVSHLQAMFTGRNSAPVTVEEMNASIRKRARK